MDGKPAWLEWDLEFSQHFNRRVRLRRATEVLARYVLEHYRGVRTSPAPGRWILTGNYEGERWEIVVEPLLDRKRLRLVTLWELR